MRRTVVAVVVSTLLVWGTTEAEAAKTRRPDLVVASVAPAKASLLTGAKLGVRDRTRNAGNRKASPSKTAYLLSKDARAGKGDLPLGSRSIEKLGPASSSSGAKTVRLPGAATAGAWFLIACADSGKVVTESSERNNCRAATTQIAITAPTTKTDETNNQTTTNQQTTTTDNTQTPSPSADLRVGITHGVTRAGTDVTWTVSVQNLGPSDAASVVLSDTLPQGSTFKSATPSAGSCSQDAGVVLCPLGTVASGTSAAVAVVIAAPTNTDDQVLSNAASVTTQTADPVSANNSATDAPTVEGFNTVITTTAVNLTRMDSCNNAFGRKCESLEGDMIADALRTKYTTDFAMYNSGGIRNNTSCPIGGGGEAGCPTSNYAPPPYTVTRGSITATLPFQNKAVTLSLSGAELRQFLEFGLAQLPLQDGRFPQVSGLCLTYDITQAAGTRITSLKKNSCGGTDISNDATMFTITMADFTSAGGDGYPNYASRATTRDVVADVVEDYLKVRPNYSVTLGRVNCSNGGGCPSG